MEAFIVIALIVGILAGFGALSIRFGVDSRTPYEGWSSPRQRPL